MSLLPTIALVSTNKDAYSETFIHNHLRLLPAKIHFLFNGYLPKQYSLNRGLTINSFELNRIHNEDQVKDAELALREVISEYLLNNKIELILCEYGPSGVEMMLIAKQLNIPLVVYFHGFDCYRDDVLRTYGSRYKLLFEIGAAFICVSEEMRLQLIDLGCSVSKLYNLPCGVDLDLFYPSQDKKKIYSFVSCGRFVEKKGSLQILQAFNKVLERAPESNLIMIGDGELKQSIEGFIEENKLKNSVILTGSLKQTEVAEIFNQSKVFLNHSIRSTQNDREGSPLVILEAGACGIPVIATKHGGIINQVIQGETGLLIEELDVAAMADSMLFLLQNPDKAHEMGSKAYKNVSLNHGLKQYTAKLWTVIARQIDSNTNKGA